MTWQPILGYFEGQEDLLDAQCYAAATQEFGVATTLPAFMYRSKALADLEDEKIWTRAWVCVGPHLRIPSQGDLLPFTVGHHGVHVQRQQDGELRAYFNFAQHGGCRFVPRQCQTGQKTSCFYTSCGHSRDRDVIFAEPGGVEPAEMYMYRGINPLKLIPVNVATLGPLAFVNVDFEPTPLAQQHGLLGETLSRLFATRMSHTERFTLESKANWKLSGNAFLNLCLDEEQVSPNTLGQLHREGVVGFCNATRAEKSALSIGTAALDRVGTAGSISRFWLYPNLLIEIRADSVLTCVLQPTSQTTTMHYCDFFALELTNLTEDMSSRLESAKRDLAMMATVAAELQAERAGRDNPSPFLPQSKETRAVTIEANALVWSFQQRLIKDLLTSHTYVDRPLYTHPGRSLNAGVNSGAF